MNEITVELLDNIVKEKEVNKLRTIFEEYNSVDLAEKINELDIKKAIFIFKTVPANLTAEVFSYLDNEYKENLVNVLASKDIKEVIEELYTDDIVDFIEEMPSNIVKKVLKSIDKELRGEVNKLLSYKENSAGSIMNIDYVELKQSDTCKSAIEKARKLANEVETISYSYVVNSKRDLIGYVPLKSILKGDDDTPITSIMEKDIISVNVDDDKEDVAKTFKKYDLSSIAVVNKDNKMLGIITSDDIIDVIDDEATEDIEKMANVVPLEDDYFEVSNFRMFAKTVVWLIVLLFTSILSTFILSRAESAIATVAVLAVFMPMITDTAGNAGSQTTALIIRGLSLGTIKIKDFFKLLRKEATVGLLVGGSLALFCYGLLWLEKLAGIVEINENVNYVFLTVSASLMLVVIVSKIIATTLPVLAKLCKLDPALMAGPLVTTLADAIAILIYFALAKEFVVPLFA